MYCESVATTTDLKVKHSADLIPVQVWGSNPAVEGIQLAKGWMTHITKGVAVELGDESALDLLFVVEK
jgi:hypothetical protein